MPANNKVNRFNGAQSVHTSRFMSITFVVKGAIVLGFIGRAASRNQIPQHVFRTIQSHPGKSFVVFHANTHNTCSRPQADWNVRHRLVNAPTSLVCSGKTIQFQ